MRRREGRLSDAPITPPAEKCESQQQPTDNLKGEYGNICLLLVLYTLQGIPMGLGRVIPMILKDRGASFSSLGTFSLQSWPFSLKLLWAPLVDCLYISRFGRRKTWMVPSQVLIGLVMIYGSSQLDTLLFAAEPQVIQLTAIFLLMNFLCATQDIAVDGWALTMLRPENATYQATCNAAGQTFGYTLGWTGVTLLEQTGVTNLSGFMYFTGLAYIAVTIVVAVIKPEAAVTQEEQPQSLLVAYGSISRMLSLKPIRTLMFVLFTWKLGFAVVDSIAPLKFQEYGVSKESMTYMGSVVMPLEILLPIFASRWTAGKMPFKLAMRCYPFKVAVVPITALLVFWTQDLSPYPIVFWSAMMLVALVGSVTTEWMFVSQIALFARVSDPSMGGTYMSFLNTVANLGSKLPPTATFFLVDHLTCHEDSCLVRADGFYMMSVVCTLVGIAWYAMARTPVRHMQLWGLDEWRIRAARA